MKNALILRIFGIFYEFLEFLKAFYRKYHCEQGVGRVDASEDFLIRQKMEQSFIFAKFSTVSQKNFFDNFGLIDFGLKARQGKEKE